MTVVVDIVLMANKIEIEKRRRRRRPKSFPYYTSSNETQQHSIPTDVTLPPTFPERVKAIISSLAEFWECFILRQRTSPTSRTLSHVLRLRAGSDSSTMRFVALLVRTEVPMQMGCLFITAVDQRILSLSCVELLTQIRINLST